MFRTSVVALSALLVLFAALPSATAKPKKAKAPASACGLSYLPFVEGTSWTYVYTIPPGIEDQPGVLKAKMPESFTINVKSVVSEGKSATITLAESYRKITRETVLTCSESGLRVPLESFFFAGELPGALGISTANLTEKGELYPGKSGLKKGESFYVEVRGPLERVPGGDSKVVHLKANLEIERQITVGNKEEVEVEHGIHSATAVEVAVSGRVILEPTPDKPMPMPQGIAQLWFTPDIGLVRAYNRLGEGWELSSHKDAAGQEIPF